MDVYRVICVGGDRGCVQNARETVSPQIQQVLVSLWSWNFGILATAYACMFKSSGVTLSVDEDFSFVSYPFAREKFDWRSRCEQQSYVNLLGYITSEAAGAATILRSLLLELRLLLRRLAYPDGLTALVHLTIGSTIEPSLMSCDRSLTTLPRFAIGTLIVTFIVII